MTRLELMESSDIDPAAAARLLDRQQQILDRIGRGEALPQVLSAIAHLATDDDPAIGAAILLIDADHQRLSCTASAGLSPEFISKLHDIEPGFSTGATDSGPIHSRDGTVLGLFELHANGKEINPKTLELAVRLAGIAIDLDRAARDIIARQLVEDELRSMTTHARCLLWHGEVTGIPGWEAHAFEFDYHPFNWQIRVQDEFAAQQILPLEVHPGETYADAWFRARFAEDDVRMAHNAADALVNGKPTYSQEFRCRDRHGNVRWQREDLTIQPIEHGRWRAFSVVTDVTDRKRAEEELRKAKETAEAASLAKDRFLAMLSHELRTPLTPVLATVNLVESRTDLPEDLRADLATIRQNIEMEARLIDDLLDLTRVNRGKVELRNETIDAHDAIRSALQTCGTEADAKHLQVTLHLDAPMHHVFADAARLQQIFWNLLKNAIKFTPDGGRIDVRTINTGDPKRLIEVDVTDTGMGIDAEMLPRLFDEFEQGERAITQRYGGLGLGLAISKALVHMQGGMLTATSAGRDCGATFRVVLPASEAPVKAADQSHLPFRSESSTSAVILLVDDHSDTLNIMSRLLRHGGYRVVTANCVASAVAAARENKIDLLVSDIGLPDGSGLDIIQQLPNVKGIALSGFGMDEDLRKSRDAGFVKHLTKPISFKVLAQAIRDVLE